MAKNGWTCDKFVIQHVLFMVLVSLCRSIYLPRTSWNLDKFGIYENITVILCASIRIANLFIWHLSTIPFANPYAYLSLSLSLSVCCPSIIPLSLSIFVSTTWPHVYLFYQSIPLYRSMIYRSLSAYFYLSIHLSICLYLYIYLYFYLSISLSVCLSLSIGSYESICICLSIFLSSCLCLWLSIFPHLPLSISVHPYV